MQYSIMNSSNPVLIHGVTPTIPRRHSAVTSDARIFILLGIIASAGVLFGCSPRVGGANKSEAESAQRASEAESAQRASAAASAQLAWADHLGEKVEIENSIGMQFTLIPPGEFMMGSSKSAAEIARQFDPVTGYFEREHPRHPVHITKPFYLGAYEVTQEQWRDVMGTEPWLDDDGKPISYVKEGDDYPATYVSWEDAVEFCKKLSTRDGVEYRLPTEAEWEYACRAGTTTMYGFGDSKRRLGNYAWYRENALDIDEHYAHRVGGKQANYWGLHDMHGNVWEWCSDWYDEEYYSESPLIDPQGPQESGRRLVWRGGSWNDFATYCRSAYRWYGWGPSLRSSVCGFRVVRVLE